MKIKTPVKHPFPNQVCKEVYMVFALSPRKIFSKDDIIDKSSIKYSRLAIVDSLLELVDLEYIIASPSKTCFALNDKKIVKMRKEITLNFKANETANNH